MLCPPTIVHPASIIFERPPARIRSSTSKSPFSGKHTMASAVSGRPPIAYTSLKRVGRGDLSKGVWVVDNRREEVDGLHQRLVGADQIHSGVVGFIEANQHVRVMLPG